MAGGQSAAAAPVPVAGRWLFSHNGAVAGWPAVAGRLAWGLRPGRCWPAGGADRLRAAVGDDRATCWRRGKPPEAALAEVVARAVDAGGGRLTLLLTDGHAITATAWGTSLCWRALPGGVVVASEPYDDDPAGWTSRTAPCWSRTRAGVGVEPLPLTERCPAHVALADAARRTLRPARTTARPSTTRTRRRSR